MRECLRLGLLLLVLSSGSVMATTNWITREILLRSGEICVNDRLLLHPSLWSSLPELTGIFKAHHNHPKNGELLDMVKRLLGNDNMEVIDYNWYSSDDRLGLDVNSKLNVSFEKPVRLQCLASYAGRKYLFSLTGTEAEPHFLIHAGAGLRLLWLPVLDAPKDLQVAVKNELDAEWSVYNFFNFTNGVQLKCTLRSASDEYCLFEAYPRSKPPDAPDPRFLRQIQDSHNMSGNDWRRAFTNCKPGKGGYYQLQEIVSAGAASSRKNPGPTNTSSGPSSSKRSLEARYEKEEPFLPKKLQLNIDGSFADWKRYGLAWSNSSPLQSVATLESGETSRFFDVFEAYYCSDNDYMYLFLKFKPSIRARIERMRKPGSIGNIGYFYFDCDFDITTGAQRPYVKADLVGCELMMVVVAGTSVTGPIMSPHVGCDIYEWDVMTRGFDLRRGSAPPSEKQPLIQDGDDGVEMALPLTLFGKLKHGELRCIFDSELLDECKKLLFRFD